MLHMFDENFSWYLFAPAELFVVVFWLHVVKQSFCHTKKSIKFKLCFEVLLNSDQRILSKHCWGETDQSAFVNITSKQFFKN